MFNYSIRNILKLLNYSLNIEKNNLLIGVTFYVSFVTFFEFKSHP